VDEIYRANIGRLVARGSFTPPAHAFPGARYIAPGEPADGDSADGDSGDWEQVREMWGEPGGE
jgi:beta-ureidopropionase